MSNHNAKFIMEKMPYAVGLQFRTAYWLSKGIEITTGETNQGLTAIIS